MTQHQWQAVTAEQTLLQDSEMSGNLQHTPSFVKPAGLSGLVMSLHLEASNGLLTYVCMLWCAGG